MAGLIGFMNGLWGRALRIVLGVALIAYGLLALGETLGIIMAVVGLVPLALGLWGRCLLELVAPRQHQVT